MVRRLRPPALRRAPLGSSLLAWALAVVAMPLAAQEPARPGVELDVPEIVVPERPGRRGLLARDGAVLQGLDKVTARISTFDAPVGAIALFGTLEITVRACQETPPTEPPESAAFVEVTEAQAGQRRQVLFTGWMFASSPALSALEHPVYDVWVIDCMKASNAASSSSP